MRSEVPRRSKPPGRGLCRPASSETVLGFFEKVPRLEEIAGRDASGAVAVGDLLTQQHPGHVEAALPLAKGPAGSIASRKGLSALTRRRGSQGAPMLHQALTMLPILSRNRISQRVHITPVRSQVWQMEAK